MWLTNLLFKKKKPINSPSTETHNHTWALVAHTYARPRKDIPAELLSGENAERLLFGVTTLVWECTTCGESRQEMMLGSDQNTLDEVLDKVDEFGNQTVTRGENKYVVNRFVQPQLINGIPVR